MSSKPKAEYRSSLALRLTLWYAAMFAVAAAITFASCYFIIASVVHQRTDAGLLEDIDDLRKLYRSEGFAALEEEVQAEIVSDGSDNVYYRVIRADGAATIETDASEWPDVSSPPEILERLKTRALPLFETLPATHREYPARVVYGALDDGLVLQVATTTEEDEALLAVVRSSFAVTIPIILAIAGALGWFMARKALRGVVEVTRAAIEISNGDLNRRVPQTRRRDEIDQLAATFNQMLDRIQALIRGMREMTDNIAHDLRSPLARIRAVAEGALTSAASLADGRLVFADTIEECDRLLHMINTMLDITETEAGMINVDVAPVDLSEVIDDACELFEPLAEDKNITLSCGAEPAATVRGNRHLLQRMLANLIDNALKYTPRGGNASVMLIRVADRFALSVRDTGVGIAEHELPKIFDRFYRGDQSRSLAGNGLGLSLALAIARAHGGDITARSVVGEGSEFSVSLPVGGGGHARQDSH